MKTSAYVGWVILSGNAKEKSPQKYIIGKQADNRDLVGSTETGELGPGGTGAKSLTCSC